MKKLILTAAAGIFALALGAGGDAKAQSYWPSWSYYQQPYYGSYDVYGWPSHLDRAPDSRFLRPDAGYIGPALTGSKS